MALIKELKGTFVGGQVSPELQNRIDLEKFNTFLKEAKNTQIKPEGGISNRAGTVFVGVANDLTYKLTINVNVSATIIINGEVFTGTTKSINIDKNSSYTYEVGAVGYAVQSGSGVLDSNKTINITLVADANNYTYTITNTQSATITINGAEQSSITESAGTLIEWSVAKTGYTTQSGKFLLKEDKTDDIELEAITGFVLTINAEPTNATIIVKKDGVVVTEAPSPMSVTLEAGSAYSYEISLNGYISETGGGILNADTTITTTLQKSKIELTDLRPTISNGKPTTYTVNHIYTYNIKKTGEYKVQLGGSKGNRMDVWGTKTKGGTAVLQTMFTSGDEIKIYRIDGGYLQYKNYAGCGVGIKVNDVWALVVGGGGAITTQTSGGSSGTQTTYYFASGGGGYNGGQANFNYLGTRYVSKGISYNGTQGSGTGNTVGSGQSDYTEIVNTRYAYGGTGYVKGEYVGQATLTTGNNNNEGYAKIEFIG